MGAAENRLGGLGAFCFCYSLWVQDGLLRPQGFVGGMCEDGLAAAKGGEQEVDVQSVLACLVPDQSYSEIFFRTRASNLLPKVSGQTSTYHCSLGMDLGVCFLMFGKTVPAFRVFVFFAFGVCVFCF